MSDYVSGKKPLPTADNRHKVTQMAGPCTNGHGALHPICRRISGENRWRLECKACGKRVDAETLEAVVEIWNAGEAEGEEQESATDPKSNG